VLCVEARSGWPSGVREFNWLCDCVLAGEYMI
jgi:hypothetical protein